MVMFVAIFIRHYCDSFTRAGNCIPNLPCTQRPFGSYWASAMFRGPDFIAKFSDVLKKVNPTELQLNKANSSDTEAPFLDLYLSLTNGIVSSKIYDKRDDFNFEIVNFPFLDGDVPRSPSYGVYILSLFVLLECALMLMTSTTETYF